METVSGHAVHYWVSNFGPGWVTLDQIEVPNHIKVFVFERSPFGFGRITGQRIMGQRPPGQVSLEVKDLWSGRVAGQIPLGHVGSLVKDLGVRSGHRAMTSGSRWIMDQRLGQFGSRVKDLWSGRVAGQMPLGHVRSQVKDLWVMSGHGSKTLGSGRVSGQ